MNRDGSARGFPLTGQDLRHFSLTVAGHAGDSHDLASTHLQRDAGERPMALVILGGELGELEANGPVGALLALRLLGERRRSDHHLREVGGG